MPPEKKIIVDSHVHVGIVGDTWPQLGHMQKHYRESLTYKVFLKYSKVNEDLVCDKVLKQLTIERIATSSVDKVVLLALDPVFNPDGTRHPEKSNVWISNEYVQDLCSSPELKDRALLGCSVHPYDPKFEDRVRSLVDSNAVLLKWLPSAQQIDLSQDIVRKRMEFLATAGPNGKPLPLLLHAGPEYAIPSTDERTQTYDYLNWTNWDNIINLFRFKKKWHKPDIKKIHQNIRAALETGTNIIFAHCGLPYFFSGIFGNLFEHSEYDDVQRYLKESKEGKFKGKCYADVSAIATPFRRQYFDSLKKLPEDLLLYGSDFPTPAFELSADLGEMMEDFKAVLKGDLLRVIIPQDNLLDVNLRELKHFFKDHPMFYNFAKNFL